MESHLHASLAAARQSPIKQVCRPLHSPCTKFPILSALAELGGAYARYCGRRLMRKLGGYEAAERRRVRRRAVAEKQDVTDNRTAEKRTVADNRAAAAVTGVPALGDIRESCAFHALL